MARRSSAWAIIITSAEVNAELNPSSLFEILVVGGLASLNSALNCPFTGSPCPSNFSHKGAVLDRRLHIGCQKIEVSIRFVTQSQ